MNDTSNGVIDRLLPGMAFAGLLAALVVEVWLRASDRWGNPGIALSVGATGLMVVTSCAAAVTVWARTRRISSRSCTQRSRRLDATAQDRVAAGLVGGCALAGGWLLTWLSGTAFWGIVVVGVLGLPAVWAGAWLATASDVTHGKAAEGSRGKGGWMWLVGSGIVVALFGVVLLVNALQVDDVGDIGWAIAMFFILLGIGLTWLGSAGRILRSGRDARRAITQ